MKPAAAALILALSAIPRPGIAQDAAPARDWPTWGYDGARTGWNRGETTLSPQNVSRLRLLWNTTVSTPPADVAMATLSAPVVVEGAETPQGRKTLLFTIGADSSLFALDADSGKIVWQKSYPNREKPQRTANPNCANTEQATPTIDKARGIVFFTTGDGMLHGLAAGTGEEKLAPIAMVAPFSRNWSLNFIDNIVYTAAGRGCGNGRPADGTRPAGVEAGNLAAVDVNDLAHPQLSRFSTSHERPAGPWGRGGPVAGPQGLYIQTADGPWDPGRGIFGNAVVAIAPKAYGLADTYAHANNGYLNGKDLDFGSGSPVIFPFGNRTLLATGGKEGVVTILDAGNLGGPDHTRPLLRSARFGNDEQTYAARGIWGGLSTSVNKAGERILYVPMWGPPAKDAPRFPTANGDAPHGSVMAFRLAAAGDGVALDPLWISRDLWMPDSVAVANDVVFAVQTAEQAVQHPDNPEGHGAALAGVHRLTTAELSKFRSTPVTQMTLFALDAEDGKTLYSSGRLLTSFTHFTGPVVALGKVFVVDHDAHVYAFGLQ
ncbi:MAG TPA: PQQ-binding-like beta-propeller repeat protein [Rhizomicrobium sp.]|nr:PQQ-binding-like beta-propeller repeat protein [Rhizomicrobium sp.]